MLPFPTTLRAVSGNKMVIVTKQAPDPMLKNQKIHLQPLEATRTPPRTGPKLGAVLVLKKSFRFGWRLVENIEDTYPKETIPTKDPLSAGVAISDTTPYAIENVPENITQQQSPIWLLGALQCLYLISRHFVPFEVLVE